MELTWIDYLVLVGFLVVTLGIGIYHALVKGRQKTVSEFLLANRKLEVIPTAVSLFVSFLSAIMILGGTAEMYQFGSIYFLWGQLCLILGTLLATFIFVPWIYRLKLVSVYEYFLLRYQSTTVQMTGTILAIIRQVIVTGGYLYAPSVAFESATGISLYITLPVIAAVAISCTALGGMRAVIWADVFQCVVMVGGLLAILVRGTMVVGGIGRAMELCEEGGRFNWIKMMILSLPCSLIVITLCCLIGLVVFAYYSMIRCDPLENGDVDSPNQILVHFIMTLFNDTPGILGLFLATLYGGALSSISTSLSGCAAIMWQNIFENRITGISEFGKALSNRIIDNYGTRWNGFRPHIRYVCSWWFHTHRQLEGCNRWMHWWNNDDIIFQHRSNFN